MQIIEDKVYAFSKDNPPCYTAQPGEVLQFNTLDCFSGRLTDETVTMKDMDFSYNITNPAAGPVYVEGAEVGDVLVVDKDHEDFISDPAVLDKICARLDALNTRQ